jgi:hypothetical protein
MTFQPDAFILARLTDCWGVNNRKAFLPNVMKYEVMEIFTT